MGHCQDPVDGVVAAPAGDAPAQPDTATTRSAVAIQLRLGATRSFPAPGDQRKRRYAEAASMSVIQLTERRKNSGFRHLGEVGAELPDRFGVDLAHARL